jgi:hypothetical protein
MQNVVQQLMTNSVEKISKDEVKQSEENLEKLKKQEITYSEYFKNVPVKWNSSKEEKMLYDKYSYELLFDKLFEKYLQTDNSKEFIKYYNYCLEKQDEPKISEYIKIYVYNLTHQSNLKCQLGFL